VQFTTGAALFLAVFAYFLFTFAINLQSSGVQHQVAYYPVQFGNINLQFFSTFTDSAVIRAGKGGTHQCKQGIDENFGFAQVHPIHRLEHPKTLDSLVAIGQIPVPTTIILDMPPPIESGIDQLKGNRAALY
jgi:hypothetical protein